MNYNIELGRLALKSMTKIPRRELLRIQDKIDALSAEPRPADVKKIRGDENLYRIRSGNYRVLYRIFDEKILVLIVDVDHRKDVYKNI